MLKQNRTLEARSDDESMMRCFMGSQRSLMAEDNYTDDRAKLIIESELTNTKFVLVHGTVICVKEVLSMVNEEQHKRVLDKINAKLAHQQSNGEQSGDEDIKVLLEEVNHNTMHNSPGLPSTAESTPPRSLGQSPLQPLRDHNHNDNSGDDWLVSSIKVDDNGKGGGGNGGEDGGDDQPGTPTRAGGGDREDGNAYVGEFTLVNSRNFDVKKFPGKPRSNLSYMDFNDN